MGTITTTTTERLPRRKRIENDVLRTITHHQDFPKSDGRRLELHEGDLKMLYPLSRSLDLYPSIHQVMYTYMH